MRKLVTVFFGVMFIMLFAVLMFAVMESVIWMAWMSGFGIFFIVGMSISMENIKWHKSYEDMERDQKESIRLTRNASKLIDKLKRKLFAQNIMNKEDVMEILDRTYEETQNDK